MKFTVFCLALACTTFAGAESPTTQRQSAVSEPLETLWSIGTSDNSAAEFQHGPKSYSEYDRDGLFIVGQSTPQNDWPYVHPGPMDAWAGSRTHEFKIYFFLKMAPQEKSRLVVDLLDTHPLDPSRLVVSVNDNNFSIQTPKGGGGASINGNASAGREHRFELEIPSNMLRAGKNTITLSNIAGSWLIYDSLSFETPAGVELQSPATAIGDVVIDSWLTSGINADNTVQNATLSVLHVGEPENIIVSAEGVASKTLQVKPGLQTFTLSWPPVREETNTTVILQQDNRTLDQKTVARQPAKLRELVDWVDPFLGTSDCRWMLTPGPWLPFSMVKISPNNQEQGWKAGYEYTVDSIAGFDHIHEWTMGGVLMMPTTGPLKTQPGTKRNPEAGYRSRFDKKSEKAGIGFYEVFLRDYGIKAELTATMRASLQRYTFPKSDSARVLIDTWFPVEYPTQPKGASIRRVSDQKIEGEASYLVSIHGVTPGVVNEYTVYFSMEFSRPFDTMGGWLDKTVQANVQKIDGIGDLGAFVTFETEQDEQILVRTGISLVSVEQAALNLKTELSEPFEWNFQAVVENQRTVWDELFKRVAIETPDPQEKVRFYTNFYRAYCARTVWNDVNGVYTDMYEKRQKLPREDDDIYGCDAFWNTFWNLNQTWNLITPDVSAKWVRSLLEIYRVGGWLPKGPAGIEYTDIMEGEHSIPLIVAAYQAGIRDFDHQAALKAMVHCQTTPAQKHPGGGHVGNQDLMPYLEYGYVPNGKGYASNTLEYAYDDWCVGQFAAALSNDEIAEKFSQRGKNWRNQFDSKTGFMRARNADGTWAGDGNPYARTGRWREGNPWQYTWFVPQDVRGLVQAMGKDRFIERLDEGLAISARARFNGGGLPVNHGNQPSMQVSWMFNQAGAPWLTQKWTREILDKYYGYGPKDGYPGDEDQGQMSGWFVISAMGLFQVDGGARQNPIYELAAPLYDKVVIQLDPKYYSGKTFTIVAPGASNENRYIQSAKLNGEPYNRAWLYQRDLVAGGVLELELGSEPNKSWGSAPEILPPSAQ